ncbi:MAG: hypothetical protein IKD37_02470 [Clostridia bacterium]|nr:hypothetical protein [Clostridia bacterium]
MVGIIIVVALVYFSICLAAASKFADIAELKGHGRKPWFAWCFWFGLAGWLMVVALPDRSAPQQKIL